MKEREKYKGEKMKRYMDKGGKEGCPGPTRVAPGRTRSNDLAGRCTALAPPCLLLCFGNSVNRKIKMLPYLTVLFVLF